MTTDFENAGHVLINAYESWEELIEWQLKMKTL